MESIMPILFAIYVVASVIAAIAKKRNATQMPRPPIVIDEDGPGEIDARPSHAPQAERPLETEIDRRRAELEAWLEDMAGREVYEAPVATESGGGLPGPSLPDRVESQHADDAHWDDIGWEGPPPRQPAAAAARSDSADHESGFPSLGSAGRRRRLTEDNLKDAVLWAEILGPPRAVKPYRPPLG